MVGSRKSEGGGENSPKLQSGDGCDAAFGRGDTVGQQDPHSGALAHRGIDRYRSAMQMDEPAHERESEAGTFLDLGIFALDLLERPAQAMQVLRGNSDAGIPDTD